MSRDINNKYWDEELETLPREELEKDSWQICRRL